MADETTVEDEVTADEAGTSSDDTSTEDDILGATPAEEAPEEPEPAPAPTDVRGEIRALLDKGYTLPQLEITTNSRGTPIAVKVA